MKNIFEKILNFIGIEKIKKYRKEQILAIIGIVFIIILFLVTSYLVQRNFNSLRNLIVGFGIYGMLAYILLLIIGVVVAPISVFPVIPLVSRLYGWFIAGILSIVGWTLGSLIAFIIARNYGSPLVRKLVSLEDIDRYEKMIPEENIFWSIVFLRISVPIDALSYILGLVSHIKLRTYIFATLIGVSPGAFIFAYIGTFPVIYQIVAFLAALVILLTGLKIRQVYRLKKKLKENIKEIEKDIKKIEIEKALPLPTVPALQEVKQIVEEKIEDKK